MAVKFRRSNDSVASIGGDALTCVLDVSYDEQGDVLVSDCDNAAGKKAQVLGGIVRTGTLTAEVESNDEAQLELIDPGNTGAWIDRPYGASGVEWTATAVTVSNRRFVSSRNNLTTYEVGLFFSGLDHSSI